MKTVNLKRYAFALILCLASSSTWAKTYLDCFKNASKHYGVPYELLTSISFTESSFRAFAANHRNRNGTADYGLMQINTLWRREAGRHGFSWNSIKTKPCVNVKFGAWILRSNYRRLGSWSQAVGAYNAGFSKSSAARSRRAAYYRKVLRNKANARRYSSRLNKRTTVGNSHPGVKKVAKSKTKTSKKRSSTKKKVATTKTVKRVEKIIEEEPQPKPLDMTGVKVLHRGQSADPVFLKEGEEAPVYTVE